MTTGQLARTGHTKPDIVYQTTPEDMFELARLREIARDEEKYEAELNSVRGFLQTHLIVGQIKHIGLLECAAGVMELHRVLNDEVERLRGEVNRLKEQAAR